MTNIHSANCPVRCFPPDATRSTQPVCTTSPRPPNPRLKNATSRYKTPSSIIARPPPTWLTRLPQRPLGNPRAILVEVDRPEAVSSNGPNRIGGKPASQPGTLARPTRRTIRAFLFCHNGTTPPVDTTYAYSLPPSVKKSSHIDWWRDSR